MTDQSRLPLVMALKASALLWCEANDRTLGALSARAINHGSFFERLESPDAGVNSGTLEKFAAFLGDPANWPADEGGMRVVPGEVCDFVHRVEGRTPECCGATGQGRDGSGLAVAP